jgi:hypothetical protein
MDFEYFAIPYDKYKIINVINETFNNLQYTESELSSKDVGIVTSFIALYPKIYNLKELYNLNFQESIYVDNPGYLDKGYEIGYITNVNGEVNAVYEIEDSLKKYVHNNITGGSNSKSNFYTLETPKLDSSMTNNLGEKFPIWVTNNISTSNQRFITYIFIQYTAPYFPKMELYESTNKWCPHLWVTSVFHDRLTGRYVTNIYNNGGVSLYTNQFARQISLIIENSTLKNYILPFGSPYLPIMDPKYSTVYNFSLPFSKKWDLCVTLGLILYSLIVENPLIASYNLEAYLKKTPKLYTQFTVLRDILKSGNKLLNNVGDNMEIENTNYLFGSKNFY